LFKKKIKIISKERTEEAGITGSHRNLPWYEIQEGITKNYFN
jgi:hypothetical protein